MTGPTDAPADPDPPVLEHAVLHVRSGDGVRFEAAFAQARGLIEATEGFGGLRLLRDLDRPDTYLLLVEWRHRRDHVEGFRGSDRYPRWAALLHPFYDPHPTVEHFVDVTSG